MRWMRNGLTGIVGVAVATLSVGCASGQRATADGGAPQHVAQDHSVHQHPGDQQPGQNPGHQHRSDQTATAPPRSHAHGAGQGHRAAEACAEEAKKVVAEGRGFGMAFAADQHGYPGPMHVLELKDVLELTSDQEAVTRSLEAAVRAEIQKSARLIDAEQRLDRLFASGGATEEVVRAVVADVEAARSEVRLVHLLAHLKMREVLTEEQRRLYHQRRWGTR
jgi:Spy/CpxP family protein refolding chaperone